MTETVRRAGLRSAYVEAIVTRGVPEPGERDPRLWTPRFYAYAVPYVWIVRPELQERGTDVVVARDTHRISPGAIDPAVKNFHRGDSTRGLFEAYDRGGWLAILLDADGFVTEGPGFNVFALVDNVLSTPARGVLHGITRKTVIEIAQERRMRVHVGDLPVSDLYRATEIFLSSTAEAVTTMIRDRYWELHSDPRFTEEIDYSPTHSATEGRA